MQKQEKTAENCMNKNNEHNLFQLCNNTYQDSHTIILNLNIIIDQFLEL